VPGPALEKIVRNNGRYNITHYRVKQRSDQQENILLVPAHGGFAARLGVYQGKMISDLNKFTGRVW
jgi:hypothetical protein